MHEQPPCCAQQSFVSVGVNRVVNALSWSEDGTMAYGAHHMAAIYDPKARTSPVIGLNLSVGNRLKRVHSSLPFSGSRGHIHRNWAHRDGQLRAVGQQRRSVRCQALTFVFACQMTHLKRDTRKDTRCM